MNFLLIFPSQISDLNFSLTCNSLIRAFFSEIIYTLDRIDCEKNTKMYYSIENKDKFYSLLKAISSDRLGLYRLETILEKLKLKNRMKPISLISSEITIDHEIILVNCFKIIDNIFHSLNSNRELNSETVFYHCENHKSYIPKKSPLIGGTSGFKNASLFLPSAIGDDRTNKDYLINIDHNNQNFIIQFENENFNNQYHAYHLVKNIKGVYVEDRKEIDILKQKGIPRAYKLINFRNNLL